MRKLNSQIKRDADYTKLPDDLDPTSKQKLQPAHLKFFQDLPEHQRPIYQGLASLNNFDTKRLGAGFHLTPAASFVARADRSLNRAKCFGYNAAIMGGIMTNLPFFNKLDSINTDRLAKRHLRQHEPFALDTPNVNDAIRKAYEVATGKDEEKAAQVAKQFAAPAHYVQRVVANEGVVKLPFPLDTREVNDGIREAYKAASGSEEEKINKLAKEFVAPPDYVKRVVACQPGVRSPIL